MLSLLCVPSLTDGPKAQLYHSLWQLHSCSLCPGENEGTPTMASGGPSGLLSASAHSPFYLLTLDPAAQTPAPPMSCTPSYTPKSQVQGGAQLPGQTPLEASGGSILCHPLIHASPNETALCWTPRGCRNPASPSRSLLPCQRNNVGKFPPSAPNTFPPACVVSRPRCYLICPATETLLAQGIPGSGAQPPPTVCSSPGREKMD